MSHLARERFRPLFSPGTLSLQSLYWATSQPSVLYICPVVRFLVERSAYPIHALITCGVDLYHQRLVAGQIKSSNLI